MHELVWKIGGEQGQGLDSTSDVFATVCNRLGYYIYGYKTFASRIKGGHTNFTVRVSTRRVQAPAAAVHVLVCMDQESIDKLTRDLRPDGLLLVDAGFRPAAPEDIATVTINFTETARELGNPLYKNMVALGASSALLGLPLQGFKDYVQQKFGRKGADVVQGNFTALERGFALAREQAGGRAFHMAAGDGRARLVMIGNDAMALGALAAGCRTMFAYPITPASEVLETAARFFPKFGGVAVQMEDELAAIGACVGAGFAGSRAMTATAGPGISLMQEYLGLASMAEIPLVVVDTQRGGPSTGMPTKHEQSDLLALIYGGHGEGPRIVLAPGNAEQAFHDTALAFNLADNYHCPVLIASDLGIALWQQTCEDLDLDRVNIDRGPLADRDELERQGDNVLFARYARTDTGVSPRSVPGMPGGQYLATGAEHGGQGRVTEDARNRTYMMNRRLDRIKQLEIGGRPVPGLVYDGPEQPEVLLCSYGSTYGAVAEAAELLRADGMGVGLIQLRVLHPLPVKELAHHILSCRSQTLVVENNALGQAAFLMRAEGLPTERIQSVLKYDGTLFRAGEVADRVRSMFGAGVTA